MDMAVSSGVTKLQKEGKLMSTSLLYHGWGLRGYEYRASGFQHGEVCFRVEQKPDTFRCSNCGSAHVQTCGQVSRRLRSLPIGRHPVNIELAVKRLWSHHSGKIPQAN